MVSIVLSILYPTSTNLTESLDALDLPQLSTAFPDSLFPECPWVPQEGAQRLLFDPTNPDYSILEAPRVHTLSSEDLDYLYKQGCFVVPQRSILNEFIQQYFLHIHPMLPMLNEADFWALYHPQHLDNASADRMPLIVIQGILFTSCSVSSSWVYHRDVLIFIVCLRGDHPETWVQIGP